MLRIFFCESNLKPQQFLKLETVLKLFVKKLLTLFENSRFFLVQTITVVEGVTKGRSKKNTVAIFIQFMFRYNFGSVPTK